jgi:Heterokaryon incompatibility protein (HET)
LGADLCESFVPQLCDTEARSNWLTTLLKHARPRAAHYSLISMLCNLCHSLVDGCLSSTKQGRPQLLEFKHVGRVDRARRARSGCELCNLSIPLDQGRPGGNYVSGAPYPASFWWCNNKFEIFELGRLTEAADYNVAQPVQDDEDFPAVRQPRRDVPRRTDAASSFALVKDWLHLCTTQHPHCKRNAMVRLPTRVIDVGAAGTGDDVHLVESNGQLGIYVALSHCCGGHQPLTTTSGNFHRHKAGILLKSLPQTFRDAVIALRAFGIRRLWIDSLCIIQDSLQD